jgi:predicted negative regulator of RcsB-dependent stress response
MSRRTAQSLPASAEQPEIDSTLLARFESWVHHNGRSFLVTLAIVGLLLVIGFRYSAGLQRSTEQSYLQAALTLEALDGRAEVSPETIDEAQGLLAAHPEMGPTFEGLLAHSFQKQGRFVEAAAYGAAVLQRVEGDLPRAHTDFAQATWLLAEGSYEKALALSVGLEERFATYPDWSEGAESLRTANLIRIGMLQQHLGNAVDELAAWDRVEEWLTLAKDATPASQRAIFSLIATFREGSIGMKEYIAERKERLVTQ